MESPDRNAEARHAAWSVGGPRSAWAALALAAACGFLLILMPDTMGDLGEYCRWARRLVAHVHDLGGVPEIVPEAAGVLVPPGDVAALRTTLEGVIEGRLLAGALEPLPLKTAADSARELAALYAELRTNRHSTAGRLGT